MYKKITEEYHKIVKKDDEQDEKLCDSAMGQKHDYKKVEVQDD